MITSEIEAQIRACHKPGISAASLHRVLAARGVDVATRTLNRWLVRNNLSRAPKRDPRPAQAEAAAPTPTDLGKVVEDLEIGPGIVAGRIGDIRRTLDGLGPTMLAMDRKAVATYRELTQLEAKLVESYQRLTPREEAEAEEIRRLGEDARQALLDRARAAASVKVADR